MARKCPITGSPVLYLDCLECEEKLCKTETKEERTDSNRSMVDHKKVVPKGGVNEKNVSIRSNMVITAKEKSLSQLIRSMKVSRRRQRQCRTFCRMMQINFPWRSAIC
ncbi:hypothetical protein [Clostridium porci]|uniref:Uncharacterized protein n=1 Tax=Clostridium porci TaxID=2605778 RepID=A0A7X2TC43_9CLOT|nr:hypothetical protein [Clostridium porci]MSS36564.1 hypothetical protein [Clostridium porci]